MSVGKYQRGSDSDDLDDMEMIYQQEYVRSVPKPVYSSSESELNEKEQSI